MGLGILARPTPVPLPEALIWISISLGGLSAASPVGWSIPSLIGPRGSVGTLGGIMNFSSQISGIVAPIVTGYLVTARHSFAWAFGVCCDLPAHRDIGLHLSARPHRTGSQRASPRRVVLRRAGARVEHSETAPWDWRSASGSLPHPSPWDWRCTPLRMLCASPASLEK